MTTNRLTDAEVEVLINKLWASDDANALTNQAARMIEALRERAEAAEEQLAHMMQVQRCTVDAANEARASEDTLREALKQMVHAVCGETGFAEAVRRDSGRAYPWPALEIAEADAIRALALPAPTADGETT